MLYKHKLYFFLFILVPYFTHAGIVDEAELLSLSESDYWLKLVHYEKQGTNNYKSAIISDGFFFAHNGATSPLNELRATISGILKPIEENPNLHAICRFPERFHWISTQIELANLVPQPDCSAFKAWQEDKPAENVSLIFATGYLNNPASYYGHLLLKFGSDNAPEYSHQDLLDKSINYGAIVPPNENGLIYIFKGLFGGYEAGYTSEQYYEHSHNYADIELRDVWEYQLSLNSDETMQLLRHSWELLDNKLIYYYAKENCAYRIAELLSLVLDKPLETNSAKWTIPVSIVEDLSEYQHKGKPLVSLSKKHLSRQNLFYEKYYQLNHDQQLAIKSVSNLNDFTSNNYLNLSDEDKIAVVDTLLDYYELLFKSSDTTTDKQGKQNTLVEMLQLSAKTELPSWKNISYTAPENGNSPQLLRVGSIIDKNGSNAVLLNWRLAYFDMLNIDSGTIPYSKLSMFDLKLELVNSRLKLKHLDLLDIDTLGIPSTNLRGDKRYSWALNAGISHTNNQCSDCSVGYITAEWGKALQIGNHSAIYARGLGQLQSAKKTTASAQAGIHLGAVLSITDWWKIKLDYEETLGLNDSYDHYDRILIEQRFGQSKNWDVRITYDDNVSKEYTLSAGYYF